MSSITENASTFGLVIIIVAVVISWIAYQLDLRRRDAIEDLIIIDYDIYDMSIAEKVFYTILAASAIAIAGYLFYRSVIICALIMPIGLLYIKIKRIDIIRKRRSELNVQFKDGLYSLSSSISAGRSLKLAFKQSLEDLEVIYPDDKAWIIQEFKLICNRLDNNETIEAALSDLSERSGLEDIQGFTDMLITTLDKGGNISRIINNASHVISDKIDVKREIELLVTSKKFEQKILSVVPFVLIMMLSKMSPSYMDLLYTTVAGRIAATVALCLIGIASAWANKIVNIEV